MNSRRLNSHVRATKYIKKLAEAINNPSADMLKNLIEAAAYIQQEIGKGLPDLSKVKAYPDIDAQYLTGIVTTLQFDVDKFSKNVEKINDGRVMSKKLAISPDPYAAINVMMGCNFVADNMIEDEVKATWKDISKYDVQKKLTSIKNYLNRLYASNNGNSIIAQKAGAKAKDSLKYIAIAVLIIGTILMNYIIVMIAFGLIALDVSLDQYYNESIDPSSDGIFDAKDYPYILNGSGVNVHVDRTGDYIEVVKRDNTVYMANNLVELIKKVHQYIDDLVYANSGMNPRYSVLNRKAVESGFPFNVMRKGRWWDLSSDEDVFRIKNEIMEMSKVCVDYDFQMSMPKQYIWCTSFIDNVESGCRTFKHAADDYMLPVGGLSQMFEIACLQIWDAFITSNGMRSRVRTVNEYLKVNPTDETFQIKLHYNMQPPLFSQRATNNAATLMKVILEGAGIFDGELLAEAEQMQQPAKPDPAQAMKGTADQFSKAIETAKNGAQQMSTKALAWCSQNASTIKDLSKNFTAEDSVTMKNYTFNMNNFKAAVQLLNSIDTFLRDEYIKNRQSGIPNINGVIAKAFPTLKIDPNSAPFPADRLANLINTGNANDAVKEQTITGQNLQGAYNQMVAMLTDSTVTEYFKSDIFTRLQQAVTAFGTATRNANNRPDTGTQSQPGNQQPKNESVMLEADANNGQQSPPKTGDQPKNPNNQTQTVEQQQKGTGAKQPDSNKPPVTNATASNDQTVLTHATNVVVSVIGALQTMANDAYSVVSAYYSVLKNRGGQQQQQ